MGRILPRRTPIADLRRDMRALDRRLTKLNQVLEALRAGDLGALDVLALGEPEPAADVRRRHTVGA